MDTPEETRQKIRDFKQLMRKVVQHGGEVREPELDPEKRCSNCQSRICLMVQQANKLQCYLMY
jgi:hypothetical protein